MSDKYILNDKGEPIAEPDLLKWARWMENRTARIVKKERIGESEISTVFLGLDHSFGVGEAVLWETMVFGGELNEEQDRCRGSREQAEAMHARMVERVNQSIGASSMA